MALLALMLLQHSRRDARVGGDGRLVLLADQDRRRWRRDEIDEALALLAGPVLAGPVSPLAASYVVQARIAAEHATAASAEDTRWDRIVEHYDLLLQLVPSPSARLARAVAVAEASGPERRPRRPRRDRGPSAATASPPSARSCCPARGDVAAAHAAYDEAIAACRNDAERAHLVEQQRALVKR